MCTHPTMSTITPSSVSVVFVCVCMCARKNVTHVAHKQIILSASAATTTNDSQHRHHHHDCRPPKAATTTIDMFASVSHSRICLCYHNYVCACVHVKYHTIRRVFIAKTAPAASLRHKMHEYALYFPHDATENVRACVHVCLCVPVFVCVCVDRRTLRVLHNVLLANIVSRLYSQTSSSAAGSIGESTE